MYDIHILPKKGKQGPYPDEKRSHLLFKIQNNMKKFRPLFLFIITVGVLAAPYTGYCLAQCS